MNYSIIKKIPPIETMVQAFPVSAVASQRISQHRQEIKAILEGRDPRLLIILGPCSAWPKEAVLDYAQRLLSLNKKVGQVLKLVMRVYIQKPRTTQGWAGPLNQSDLSRAPDLEAGMRYSRDMMVKVVEMGLPIADEALLIENAKGFLDLLSWVAIGARSSENQAHRVFASALNCAVGLKNPTHGALSIAVNSVVSAQHPHVAIFDGSEVKTHGNAHAHLVLRGANGAPNYEISHLEAVQQQMEKHGIQNPSLLIDVSHDNCLLKGIKRPQLQPKIIFEIMQNIQSRPDLKPLLKGFMLESFLKEGAQAIHLKKSEEIDLGGLSITDPCLAWEETEAFLLEFAARMRRDS